MKRNIFKKGDQIAVLDEDVKGIVVSINNELIQIKDEHGFLHFYQEYEIVKRPNSLLENIKVKNKDKIGHQSKKTIKKPKKETELEVDLHIHQITQSNRFMSNADMLQKQISTAKTKLNYAIKNNIKKIIFIHGKGQGVLKAELLFLLKNYPVEINDASYKKYGQGAMEVRIFRTKV